MFSGTGIRDTVDSGYLEPNELGLSEGLQDKIATWLKRYEEAHFAQYADKNEIEELDKEGIQICNLLKVEMPDTKIEYYSNGTMQRQPVN